MADRIWFKSPKHTGQSSESCEQRLADALKARDELLKERPSLQAYQAEIDRTLQNVIGHEERMAVLAMMMEAKIRELGDSLGQLLSVTNKADPSSKRLDGKTGREHRRYHPAQPEASSAAAPH